MRCQSSFLNNFFSSMTSPLSSVVARSEAVSSNAVGSFSSVIAGGRGGDKGVMHNAGTHYIALGG